MTMLYGAVGLGDEGVKERKRDEGMFMSNIRWTPRELREKGV
jgi:hypothetical protein